MFKPDSIERPNTNSKYDMGWSSIAPPHVLDFHREVSGMQIGRIVEPQLRPREASTFARVLLLRALYHGEKCHLGIEKKTTVGG